MDAEFWHSKWASNKVSFHLHEVNPFLQQFWSATSPVKNDRVLVPLCGKSEDLIWLARQHHEVIGVELSSIAVRSFFSEHFYTPLVTRVDSHHELYQFDELSLYQGDIFTAPLAPVDIIYDRAALTALAPVQWQAYAERLVSLLCPGGRILLVTTNYCQHERQGPPFSISKGIIKTLFAGASVTCLLREAADHNHRQIKEKGLTCFADEVWLIEFPI
jgi:thiopurine S-methyltransferase